MKRLLMRARARSRLARVRSKLLLGVLNDVVSASVAAAAGALLLSATGLREKVSVLAETKMGVLPGIPAGNLGMGISGLGVVVVVVTSLGSRGLKSSFLELSLSRFNWLLCLSRSLCLKGLGRRNRRLEMIEGLLGSTSEAAVGLMEADAAPPTLEARMLERLLLNLAAPRLKKLAREDVVSAEVVGSSEGWGLLEKVSVLAETKMGVLPGRPAGNLGMGMSGLGVVVVVVRSLGSRGLKSSFLELSRSLFS